MSANSCEQYARAILGRIGGPSFEQVMMRIIQTAAPKDGGYPPSDPDTYYLAVSELFPHVAEDSDVVGRLVLLTMLAGTLRLEAHPSLMRHGRRPDRETHWTADCRYQSHAICRHRQARTVAASMGRLLVAPELDWAPDAWEILLL
jgi:hypothetical protein